MYILLVCFWKHLFHGKHLPRRTKERDAWNLKTAFSSRYISRNIPWRNQSELWREHSENSWKIFPARKRVKSLHSAGRFVSLRPGVLPTEHTGRFSFRARTRGIVAGWAFHVSLTVFRFRRYGVQRRSIRNVPFFASQLRLINRPAGKLDIDGEKWSESDRRRRRGAVFEYVSRVLTSGHAWKVRTESFHSV